MILAGHFQATRDRVHASSGPLLILQDTTEFSYKRDKPELVGFTGETISRKDEAGRWRKHTVCGILMHSSLAATADGLPLGLCAIKFWSRQKFKGTNALKKKINPTRVPIEEKESFRWLQNLRQSTALISEPERCVHIGDRESDRLPNCHRSRRQHKTLHQRDNFLREPLPGCRCKEGLSVRHAEGAWFDHGAACDLSPQRNDCRQKICKKMYSIELPGARAQTRNQRAMRVYGRWWVWFEQQGPCGR